MQALTLLFAQPSFGLEIKTQGGDIAAPAQLGKGGQIGGYMGESISIC